MNPGCVVQFRGRDWVLLPNKEEEIYTLRPLAGTSDEVVCLHKGLSKIIAYDLNEECVRPSRFPLPSSDNILDVASANLLWQAARLTLREGAAPLRSLGRISIRPRRYQFVPLLMALRLDPVRLFIADDVGVGKTIEALLIARELLDRGEVQRLAVLCPPYLCEQWRQELEQKFNLEAVIIRSSTIAQLDRNIPADQSVYQYYPIQVISIDWVKSDRNRHQFLQFCPELVVVDEAHAVAESTAQRAAQQQRHRLLRKLVAEKKRHIILLTATPHCGVAQAFQSLLGLLRPEFEHWDVANLDQEQRVVLAQHFVQRTRTDIESHWETEPCFPQRLARDESYALSPEYQKLFSRTYDFCTQIVESGQRLELRRRRVRYWGALALLRCVMSSPAAAVTALHKRAGMEVPLEDEDLDAFGSFVFESDQEVTNDESPRPPIEAAEDDLSQNERRRLRELARLAQGLRGPARDTKLRRCTEIVQELLGEGFSPIVWCRYIATAEYVAEHLRQVLSRRVQVVAITGRMGPEERRAMIEEISPETPRVLVTTDCLSEGINLQARFTAVLHYDLPWNPNRLEQREGRVDRYGQTAPRVKAVRFYGRDNPVDGVVLEVLLNKAREIHRTLGTYVPVPEESESVTEAILNALFLRRRPLGAQMELFVRETVADFHSQWDHAAERERRNRTRFAQRALKPEDVQRELEATDKVLGDPEAVREFVLAAAQRLELSIRPHQRREGAYLVAVAPEDTLHLPVALREALPGSDDGQWRISFRSPTPEGAEYLGRNHRFVATLARYLLEEALSRGEKAAVSRCGVIRTRDVDTLTSLLLLRVRYLVEIPQAAPLLSEEVLVVGYQDRGRGKPCWLAEDQALGLLARARPHANLPRAEKRELVQAVLDQWPGREAEVTRLIQRRAAALRESHKRIRKAVSLRVRELKVSPQLPPDLLGVLVLQPVVPS